MPNNFFFKLKKNKCSDRSTEVKLMTDRPIDRQTES